MVPPKWRPELGSGGRGAARKADFEKMRRNNMAKSKKLAKGKKVAKKQTLTTNIKLS